MDSKLSEHAKPTRKPEKESDKSLSKVEPEPKQGSLNPLSRSKDEPSKTLKNPRDLAIRPQNDPSKTPKELKNLALGPQNDPSKTLKEPRDLAIKPQNNPLKTPKELKNLALGPQNDPSKTLKEPKNPSLGHKNDPSSIDNSPSLLPKNIIHDPAKGLTRRRYSEKHVRDWIQQYKQYKSLERVRNHLHEEGKKVPSISTMKTRMKQLMGEEKYKELMKKYTFKDVEKIVKTNSINRTGVPGKILSKPEEFKTVKSKLSYQCGKCNHSWKTSVDTIINKKSWCPKCAVKQRVDTQRGSVGDHKKIITEKGGRLIKVIYENPKEKLFNQRTRFEIRCKADHKFTTRAQDLKQGKWCRECSYKVIGEKLRGSFKDIQNLIEKRGGKCLTKPEDYKNQHQNLKILCSENHIFKSAPSNFIRGDWCPQCSQGKFERLSRKFFEEIFQKEFPKERPNWLVNSRGNQMELDGYNKDLKLAFEAQGEQHYRAVPHFNQTLDDLEQRIRDDLRKLELCKQNDVTLIQVPYFISPNNMQQYITNQYEHLSNQKLANIPEIDYNKFYNTKDDQKKMDNYL